MEDTIISWLREYAKKHSVRIMAAGLGVNSGQQLVVDDGQVQIWNHDGRVWGVSRLAARLWFELDVLPVILQTSGQSIDERACSGARKAEMYVIPPGNLPRINVGYRHEVEVDGNGALHICDLQDFQSTVCKQTWDVLMKVTKVLSDLPTAMRPCHPHGFCV